MRKIGSQIREMLSNGVSHYQIRKQLKCSGATVSYHRHKLGLPKHAEFGKRYDWSAIQKYYDQGKTVSDCVTEFGFARAAWSKAVNRGAIISRGHTVLPFEEIQFRSGVRARVIKEKLLEYKCEICGIFEWLGKALSLRLDHKNGIKNDHRIENLRWLCPNCDSQQPTFAGRNTKRQRDKRMVL